VPHAALAVDQQVERGVHEVDHVRGRDHLVVGRRERLARGQRAEREGDEVVRVPRPEERRRAHHERLGEGVEHARLHLGLGAPVDA
jgi:hypothetical protein